MTITLGGITVDDNLYLDGLENASLVAIEQLRTVDGFSVVRATATPGGRNFSLGTQNRSGALQGLWTSTLIDQIKVLEAAATTVTLDYRGTSYNVLIVETNFTPLFQWEAEGSTKRFTGSISLIEV